MKTIDTDLPLRVKAALVRAGLLTVDDIVAYKPSQLWAGVRGLGVKGMAAVCKLRDGYIRSMENNRYNMAGDDRHGLKQSARPDPAPHPTELPPVRAVYAPARVYVIGRHGSGVVKIGVSGNTAKRLYHIQNGNPCRLSILWETDGDRGLEIALHRRFAKFRCAGEWFDFGTIDPVRAVADAVIDIIRTSPASARPDPLAQSARPA